MDINFITPIVDFLAVNRENTLVSYVEHPQAFQVKFYLENRKVKYVDNLEEFNKTITVDESFSYLITKSYKDSGFLNYTKENYLMIQENDYLIFFLR